MSTLRRNIVANFLGTAWTTLVGLAAVPIYIRFLGIEAYGLIGLFATVQVISSLLEVGLSPTMNRELARLSSTAGATDVMRDLVRTVEAFYWIVAAAIGLLIVGLSPIMAAWVNPQNLRSAEVQHAFLLMGIAFAIQWPSALYVSGLLGLQRHTRLNATLSATSTVRALGGVLALWLIAPTVSVFFTWQILAAIFHTSALAYSLWAVLPTGSRPRVSLAALRGIWRFAAGMTGIAVLKVILTQADKLILSKLLPLDSYGYYALAGTAASVTNRLIGPFFTAYFPNLSQLVASDQPSELRRVYHTGGQILAVTVLPVAAVIALFSREILIMWTSDPAIAANAYLLLSLMVTGTALNGLMTLPYALQLASGWTRLPFLTALIAVLLLVPFLVFATLRWGAVGGAIAWIALNAGYLAFSIPVMHRKLLRGDTQRWYIKTVGAPLAATLAIVSVARMAFPVQYGLVPTALELFLTWLLATSGAALTIPFLRERVFRFASQASVWFSERA